MQAAAAARSLPDPAQPLRQLLVNLARESGELASSADQLQRLFGQLVAEAGGRPHDALERAQVLDALTQRLQGLQAFLAGLSGAELHDLQADVGFAASRLKLTSQAKRLHPGAGEGVNPAAGLTGDCDLF